MNGHTPIVPDFVPSEPPLTHLPPPFTQWDDIAASLPTLLSSQDSTLHAEITTLPLLSTASLTTIPQLHRAYVVLGFLIHAYVWCDRAVGDTSGARIPQQLAQPYTDVCRRLGLEGRETLAYAGLCSWNWGFKDGAGGIGEGNWELEKMDCLVSFTGTRDEAVFYLVPVMVEREVQGLVGHLVEVLEIIQPVNGESADGKTVGNVTQLLTELGKRLIKMQAHMKLLHQHCDPAIFYNQVRKYFAGGKGSKGWIFELADGSEVARWCVGGSAAQSATFPFLDAVLGVKHDKMGGEVSVFGEMREYMPGEQREFLSSVEGRASIGDFVRRIGGDEPALLGAYNAVLEELARWRSKHIGVVTTHIVSQARKEKKEEVKAEEVTDGLSVRDEGDLQGTGGSALIPFLKGATQDTERARK
ncbi:Indoleamine 2,3-dioxygenase [Cyphellophora attinorum]|uniref:Indoleamine 2,3-dioxygenase n=1 Tax=Cyphellophora attinorum TaxID=1664694 RepID=A0A0N0NPD3_9EURO|nr:Indoleamine 2,3-dioxygenase [Phialophora attinorum]KPI42409.1 Indoleamine 2,3-dioxygenase [Phialophora attinorum]